jgi:DNA-binding transcriptional LysR family regulator
VAELAAHDWVLYRAHDGRAQIRLTGPDGNEESCEVSAALVADDLPFCLGAAESGAGLALLPIHAVVESLRAQRLEPVLHGWLHTGNAVYVVVPSARQLPARVALVRDFLVELLTRRMEETHARCAKAKRPLPR